MYKVGQIGTYNNMRVKIDEVYDDKVRLLEEGQIKSDSGIQTSRENFIKGFYPDAKKKKPVAFMYKVKDRGVIDGSPVIISKVSATHVSVLGLGDDILGENNADYTREQFIKVFKPTAKKKKPVASTAKMRTETVQSILEEARAKDETGHRFTDNEILAYAKRVMAIRGKGAKTLDAKKSSVRVLAPTYTNLLRWATNTGRYDMAGVDTKPGELALVTTKARINDAKFWNQFGL